MKLRAVTLTIALLLCNACATTNQSTGIPTYDTDDKDIKPFVAPATIPSVQPKEDTKHYASVPAPSVISQPSLDDKPPVSDEPIEWDHRIPADAKITGAVFDKPYVVRGETYHRLKYVETFEQVGIASWYGGPDHGKATSNGETYDMYAMTAAHKNLPMGSLVEVENLENGKKIKVRINDRGPHVAGRIIDLSKTGAQAIGIKDKGLGKVKIKLLEPVGEKSADDFLPDSPNIAYSKVKDALFAVQVASFTDLDQAQSLASSFDKGKVERAVINGKNYYRVKIGGFPDRESAEKYKGQMVRRYPNSFVVTE